jgi:hypothetical protein
MTFGGAHLKAAQIKIHRNRLGAVAQEGFVPDEKGYSGFAHRRGELWRGPFNHRAVSPGSHS